MSAPTRFPLALVAALLAGAFSSAFGQTTTTWTSASDPAFANGANWNNGAPVDDLTSNVAQFSTASLANPVLTASQSVAGLAFSTGTTLSSTGGAILTVGGSNIAVSNGAATTVVISAPLAGTATLSKTGAGALTLSGANTQSGNTTLSGGTLNLGHASALGTGTLTLPGTATFNNTTGGALTLSTNNAVNLSSGANSALVFTGTNSLNLGTGAVTLSGSGTAKTVSVAANTLTFGGAVGGAANLNKAGAGTLVLAGPTSFAALNISAGTLTLSGPSTRTGQTSVTFNSTLNINDASALGTGTLVLSVGKLDNTSGGAIVLTTNNAQAWNISATFTGTNSLNLGTGAVSLSSSSSITVNASTLTVGGAIGGAFGITKLGAGTLALGGASGFTGTTAVNAGTLLVNGSLGSSSAVTVNAGGILAGSGTINGTATIASGGTLAPGNSPGLLTFGSDLTLAAGSTTAFQINGTGRGTSFDGVNLSTGTLAYGGTFNLVFGTTIAGGTTLDLFSLSGNGSNGSFSSILASGSYNGSFANNSGIWTLVDGAQTLTFTQGTGDLAFVGTAIPEPSTYAALFGAGALGFAAWRRRPRQSAT